MVFFEPDWEGATPIEDEIFECYEDEDCEPEYSCVDGFCEPY